MADNFDLQGWMRENKQGPFSGFSSKKETFKSSKPKSKTGLNESLMGMIDLQPVGSLSEDLNEGSFIIDYNDAEYIQYMLDQAGINAMAKQGLDDEEVEIYGDAKALNKAKKLLQKDGFEIGGPATSIGKYKHDSSQFTGEYTGMDEEAGKTIHVSSDDNFKVEYGGKDWTVEYDNHEVGDDITLSSGSEKKTGVVKNVSPNGDITIELNETMYEMEDDDMEDDAPEIEDTWNNPSEFDNDDDEEKMAAMAMKQAKSGKKGMKGITADWTIDDILGGDDDDF